jgi:hypothetical protein
MTASRSLRDQITALSERTSPAITPCVTGAASSSPAVNAWLTTRSARSNDFLGIGISLSVIEVPM